MKSRSHFCRLQIHWFLVFSIILAAAQAWASGPPTINDPTKPADTNVFLGQNAAFTVDVSSSSPVTYQWFYNSQPLSDQTNQTLNLIGAVTNDAALYSVVVTNDSGSVTSRLATLTVVVPDYGPKANINLLNVVAFRGENGLIVNGTITGAANSGAFWGTDIYTDDSFLPQVSIHTGSLADGELGTVSVRVLPGQGNYIGSTRNGVTSGTFGAWIGSYEIAAVVPTFTNQPVHRVAFNGDTVSFSATAFCKFPFTYQWLRNGVEIPGETNATLKILSASPAISGSYAVQGRTTNGTNASETAQLIVLPGDSGGPPVANGGNIGNLPGVAGTVYHVVTVGDTNAANIWGTGIYTSDSAIARAAVQLGLLQNGQTGTLTLVILPGQPSYFGSLRDGVQSMDFAVWPRSYGFVDTHIISQPSCTNLTVTFSTGGVTTNVDLCAAPAGKLTISNTGTNAVNLSWPSQSNATYLLESSDALNPTAWTQLWAGLGTGSNIIVPDPTAPRLKRFYRLWTTEP